MTVSIQLAFNTWISSGPTGAFLLASCPNPLNVIVPKQFGSTGLVCSVAVQAAVVSSTGMLS